jgi:hypothetical protein
MKQGHKTCFQGIFKLVIYGVLTPNDKRPYIQSLKLCPKLVIHNEKAQNKQIGNKKRSTGIDNGTTSI